MGFKDSSPSRAKAGPRTTGLALLLLLTQAVSSQCPKPSIPTAGLPTTAVRDVSVTYSDNYRTLLNLDHPSGTAPACGWPLVVFVHGYGGRRSNQSALASRGFAVVSYDVRGQGTARTLNPTTKGLTWYGPVERYDLAEIVAFARNRWPNLTSATKLAVTGASQGGIHAWFAAAESGRTIQVAGRGSIRFPQVAVAIPQNFIPNAQHHGLRDRTWFSIDAFNRLASNAAAVIDPPLRTLVQSRFLTQDFAGLAQALWDDPGRRVLNKLATTTVPIHFSMAYFDGIQQPREAMGALRSIPSTTPVQAILSTIGHGSTNNVAEARLRAEQRLRWLDRYLWDVPNQAEFDLRSVRGVTPLQLATLGSRTSLWDHRHDAQFAAADVTPERLFTTSTGTLQATPPTAGAPTTIRHVVSSGFTPQAFLANGSLRSTQGILQRVPLSERVFRLAPLATTRELGGSPRVSLRVTPDAPHFHLFAFLSARIPGQAAPVMLSSWGRGIRGATAGVPQRVTFELAPTAAVLPAGTELRLVVRNHWLREAPMRRGIAMVPYFNSFAARIAHGSGAEATWVELPMRNSVRAGLVANRNTMNVGNPGEIAFDIRGGSARAGRRYVQLVSLSGHGPGLTLPGGVVPLRRDPIMDAFLGLLGSPWPPGFFGTLDATGNRRITVPFQAIPIPPELRGLRLSFAAWILDGSATLNGAATNPVDLNWK